MCTDGGGHSNLAMFFSRRSARVHNIQICINIQISFVICLCEVNGNVLAHTKISKSLILYWDEYE